MAIEKGKAEYKVELDAWLLDKETKYFKIKKFDDIVTVIVTSIIIY